MFKRDVQCEKAARSICKVGRVGNDDDEEEGPSIPYKLIPFVFTLRLSLLIVVEAGITTETRDVHSEKPQNPILTIQDGNSTTFSDLHPAKA